MAENNIKLRNKAPNASLSTPRMNAVGEACGANGSSDLSVHGINEKVCCTSGKGGK
jgi:hypothetical protein